MRRLDYAIRLAETSSRPARDVKPKDRQAFAHFSGMGSSEFSAASSVQ